MAEKSSLTKEWVADVVSRYPPAKLPNGNIRLFGRFAFCNVLERPIDKKTGKEKSYGLVLLIPEGTDLSVLKYEAKELFRKEAPQALENPELARKFNNPFKKQEDYISTENGEMYDGFVKGRVAMSFNSPQSKPLVTDKRMAPIIDKKDIYSGAWGFVEVHPAWFSVDGNKGPTFYLQQLMKIEDDDSLGGMGRADPKAAFGDISITSDVNPSDAFGVADPPADDATVDIFA